MMAVPMSHDAKPAAMVLHDQKNYFALHFNYFDGTNLMVLLMIA